MILTPKEKAEELVYKFMDTRIPWKQSKLCALTAVDELIKATVPLSSTHFWEEVKKEIEKL